MKAKRWLLVFVLSFAGVVLFTRILMFWQLRAITREEFLTGIFEAEIQVAESETLGWTKPHAFRVLDRKTGRRFYLPDFLTERSDVDPIVSFNELFMVGRKLVLSIHPKLYWIVGVRDLDARQSLTPVLAFDRLERYQGELIYWIVMDMVLLFGAIGGMVWVILRRSF